MDWLSLRLIAAAIAGSACLFLGALSFWRNRFGRINRIFALFNLFLGLWNLSDIAIAFSSTHTATLFFDRLSYVWATPVVPLFYYLCLGIAGIRKRNKIFDWFVIVVGAFLVLGAFSPWLIVDVETEPFMVEVPGPVFPVFSVYVVVVLGLGLWVLFLAFQSSTGLKRNQLKYALLAMVFALLSGVSYLISLALPQIPWSSPVYYALETSYSAIMAFAIFRYRLMDIQIVFRRAGLLLAVYLILLLLAAPLARWLHLQAVTPSGISSVAFAIEVAFLSSVLSLGPFFYAHIVRRSSYFHEETMAGLTHELKSPLAAIESAIEILDESTDPKQRAEYADMIRRNSERLSHFVNNLLQVMKTNRDEISIDSDEADLKEICRKAIALYEPLAATKNIVINFRNGTAETVVSCDSEKIQQVISNLLSNAIKFTSDGKISVGLEEKDDHVVIEVKDSGKGIPANELPHVFDRFFQGEAGRRAKGTGIGLAIAKSWVEAHGGEIFAESDGPGKGSRFWFTLPR